MRPSLSHVRYAKPLGIPDDAAAPDPGDQSAVRDSDAMSVAREISQNLIRARESRPDADDPVQLFRPRCPFLEVDRVREFAKLAVKRQLFRGKRFRAEEPHECGEACGDARHGLDAGRRIEGVPR